jgi:hypothetical protein
VSGNLTANGNVSIGTTSSSYKLAIAAGDINIDDGRALRQAGRWVIGGNSNVLSIGSSNAPDGRDISFDPGFSGALTVKKDTGNVGIGTTNPTYKLEVVGDVKANSIHSKPKVSSFKVEGDFDKFYPVVFFDDNWLDGPMVLEINRPSIHTDSEWRGSLNSKFTCHSSWWGHGANLCRAEIYNTRNPFIAGYENYYFYNRFVIWLRGGGTTYFWRTNHFVTLGDYSAKEKIVKIEGYEQSSVNYPIKTNIDPYVLYNGISFDQNLVVQGSVGIGTAKPAYKLDVAGEVHASNFPNSSDVRLKTNVTPLTNVLEKLEKIRGISFEWNEVYEALGRSTGHREIGVTAQDVEAVFPELVTTWGDEGYKAVDYGRLTGVLIEAAKELKAENEALKQRIEALERAREKK